MNKPLAVSALEELAEVMMTYHRIAHQLDFLIQEVKHDLDSKDSAFLEHEMKVRHAYLDDFRHCVSGDGLIKRTNQAVEKFINAVKAEEEP